METPSGFQQTDVIAQRYGVTPAALLDVHDPFVAWCVNEACAVAGSLTALETPKPEAPVVDGNKLGGRYAVIPRPENAPPPVHEYPVYVSPSAAIADERTTTEGEPGSAGDGGSAD